MSNLFRYLHNIPRNEATKPLLLNAATAMKGQEEAKILEFVKTLRATLRGLETEKADLKTALEKQAARARELENALWITPGQDPYESPYLHET